MSDNVTPERIWIPKHDLPIKTETSHGFISTKGRVFNYAVGYIRDDIAGDGKVEEILSPIRDIWKKYEREYNSPDQMPSFDCQRKTWQAIKETLELADKL